MRLLLITNVFPNPFQPTKGVFNLQLARAIALEHDLRVVAPISWTDEWKAQRNGQRLLGRERCQVRDGFEVHYPRYYYPPKILRSHYGWFFWQSVRRTIKRVLAGFQPDGILTYWAHPDGQVAVRVARSLRAPVVVMVGGTDVLILTKQRRRRRCVLKVLHEADAVVTTSVDLKAKVIDFGISEEKVQVVYRGVDGSLFFPGEKAKARERLGIPVEDRMLLWIGRMLPVKGLDVLLQACARLREGGLEFRLYLVGDGPSRKALELHHQRLGLVGKVFFVGSVPHHQLPDWYRAADLMVLPSRSEGIPNVLREALACRTPFVASRVGGIPEIADPSLNQLVPPDNPQALAEAISYALMNFQPGKHPFRSIDWKESAICLLRVLIPLVRAKTDNLSREKPQPLALG